MTRIEAIVLLHVEPPLNLHLRQRCISLGNLKLKRIFRCIVMGPGSSILCRHPKASSMLLNLASYSVVPRYKLLSTSSFVSFDANDLSVCQDWLWSAKVIYSAWLVEGVQEWINYCGKSKSIFFVSADHPASSSTPPYDITTPWSVPILLRQKKKGDHFGRWIQYLHLR